jgi:hypothetical protein
MLALIVGSALSVAGLLYVLMPLLRGAAATHVRGSYAPEEMPEASALEAMREIEFDQATGKLSPEDYATLRATYAPRALAELQARDAGVTAARVAAGGRGTAEADAAERLIARMRSRSTSCPTHGPRPESDALYCSDCGQYLSASCLRCGAAVTDPQSRFCGECGSALAA